MKRTPLLISFAVLLLGQGGRLQGQSCEVPATAPKGGWLLESDSLAWSRERHNEARDGYESSCVGFGDLLFSRGITERLDLQFGYGGWYHERSGYAETLESRTYSGNATLRMKWAFWGKDGKDLAFALLPYCARPVHGGGRTTHGLLVPWSQPLPEGFCLNGQVGFERYGGEDRRWVTDLQGNLCLTREFGGSWGAYVEWRSTMPCQVPRVACMESGPGLFHYVNDRLTLEVELLAGLGRRAPDWTCILRVAWLL